MLFRSLALLVALLPVSAAAQNTPGVVAANIDTAVKPGDDFYLYANGKWMARTQIPAARASVSAFSELNDITDKRVAGIIDDAVKSKALPRTDQRRMADLYRSFMDEAALNARGLAMLKPQFDAINKIASLRELSQALGATIRADVDALNNTNFHTPNIFGLWVAPGFNDPTHYTPYLLQGGLLLPSRDYYLDRQPQAVELRKRYLAHITAIFRLAGIDHPDVRAARVLDLETALAQRHVTLAESENIQRANNVWKREDFSYNAPGLDWNAFFEAAGLSSQNSFIIYQPRAFVSEVALIATADYGVWQDYLKFHLIETNIVALPKAFQDEAFSFFGTVLSGATEQRPRSERAVNLVDAILGDAVGQVYVKRYFSAEQKAQVQALVANLLAAFHKRLETLDWMAPATRKEAIAKLDALRIGIGYPEKFRTYDGLDIRANDLLGNLQRASLFEYRYQVSRLGKPVDHGEWVMTPQTVNAVNLPLHNALNFPAAILQPPFFDPNAPAAFNYGAIGSVIGHEISHTFDSQGAAFDAQGRMRNWWTPEDFKHFQASTDALAKQYDAYKPFPDLNINGKQTLGENIADVAGLLDAWEAFQASLQGAPGPEAQGFSATQQFFLGYAQSRANKVREPALRRQVLTDPHSPSEYRADTVRNLDAWYPAFNVKEGEKLYLAPDKRVRIY